MLQSLSMESFANYKYQEGEKLSWGHYTVVGPVEYEGKNGPYFSGNYLVRCVCGSTREVKSGNIARGIMTQANWIFSCGCQKRPRKPRQRSSHYVDCTGMTIGRFTIVSWVDGKGWECLCVQCEGAVYINQTYKLIEGIYPCKGPCGK